MLKTATRIFVLCSVFIIWNQTISSQCTEQGNVWDKSWVSCTKTANPNPSRPSSHWLLFEFGQAESINMTKIWNANRSGQSSMGVEIMNVDYSLDGSSWISLGSFTLSQAPESPSYSGITGPNFGGVFVKKILFTVVTNYGHASCSSLAEVQFNIDPTTCYGILDECGVCNGPGRLNWYRDADSDGLGDPDMVKYNCSQPSGYVSNADDLCDNGLYGWAEIGPLFEENGCTGCHGNSGGLDLTSYDAISAGGTKCGTNLLTGNNLVSVITITGFAGCSSAISGQKMNDRVGGAMDSDELAMIQHWINNGAPEFCQCPNWAPDSDNDGVCDEMDFCPGYNNQLIGTACNDGLPCTINDKINEHCNCIGEPAQDSDNDGVCDTQDAAPNEPCTADGTIDGIEPAAWTGSINNDCDSDGIPLGQGDLDDFEACINQNGLLTSVSCTCDTNVKIGGGQYISHVGVGVAPTNSGGMPDGVMSGNIGIGDKINFAFPYLPKGTEICFHIGFFDNDGIAAFELNDIGTYYFENDANIIGFGAQEFCFQTVDEGPQDIVVRPTGVASMKVDGSIFEYCECSISDPEELSPDCQCPSNQAQFTGNYVSEIGGINNAANAAGLPDNVTTGNLGYLDTLTLSYPQLQPSSKICFTAGFGDDEGVIHFEQSGSIYSFSNTLDGIAYTPQEFCFVIPEVLTDNLLIISEFGVGSARIDGSIVYACNSCLPSDPDSDGDGVCDANDPCPNSVNNDSDNDGICDDIDICIGFNDILDSDGDGVPNGCDLCAGGNDALDSDQDGVPNYCDQCPGNDDSIDSDQDGIPNACDSAPCLNFITELTSPLIYTDQAVHFQILSNGYVENVSDLHYSAGQTLFFEIGFEVKAGASFLASIEPCPN